MQEIEPAEVEGKHGYAESDEAQYHLQKICRHVAACFACLAVDGYAQVLFAVFVSCKIDGCQEVPVLDVVVV